MSATRGPSGLWAALRVVLTIVALELALLAAFIVRFEFPLTGLRMDQFGLVLVPVVVLEAVALRLSGAHRHSWRYTGLRDVIVIGAAMTGAATVLLAVRYAPIEAVPGWARLPVGVILANWVLSSVALAGARMLRRLQSERAERRRIESGEPERTPVLLLGAGRAGVLVAEELRKRPDSGLRPVGFVDDDPAKLGQRVAGLDVLGTTDELEELSDRHGVSDAVITMASVSRKDVQRIVEACRVAELSTQIIPGLYEIVGGHVDVSSIRPVDVEDLLGRDPVELDTTALHGMLNGKVVLVTGAGGSIGSELVRQAVRFGPAVVVLVERSEPALWRIERELRGSSPHLTVHACIGDVVDAERMGQLFAQHEPDVVLHAAAHKHVPMMERHPGEAIKNNVGGTRTVTDVAARHGVDHFVLISTDKAVNPTSVMGATKRLTERYVQHVAEQTGLNFVSVRFGNVLGSAGSVVPIFQEQVREGGPLTVTHPDMVRYFMTIPEAAGLVLQAASLGNAGEILVLDMGEPVRITELAENVIRLSGFEPGRDIEIVYTGLRPGEKMFEELSQTSENATRTRHPKVWIGRNPAPVWEHVGADLDQLLELADCGDGDRVVAGLCELVCDYTPQRDDLVAADGPSGGDPAPNGD